MIKWRVEYWEENVGFMIYFDNSATTKPNAAVLETYTKVASNYFANPSSLHRFGAKSKELLDA